MACGEITRGAVVEDCADIPPGGTRARILLANLEDVVSFTEDADEQITAITMDSGKTFYEFSGFRNDIKSFQEVIKPEIGLPKFKHSVGLIVYENTQLQKNNVENIARGKFVAIIENKGKDVHSFEVVGKGVGLAIVAGQIRNAHENGGFFVLTLSTEDDLGELEPQLPQTITAASYAAALALVEDLLPAS